MTYLFVKTCFRTGRSSCMLILKISAFFSVSLRSIFDVADFSVFYGGFQLLFALRTFYVPKIYLLELHDLFYFRYIDKSIGRITMKDAANQRLIL